MATFLSRKFFSRQVTLPSNVATSVAALMRAAPAVTGSPAWGTNADGTPSKDSFTADMLKVTPASETLYYGYDDKVGAADTATTYKGVNIQDSIDVTDYMRGPVDTNTIYLYSVNAQAVDILFQGI